jgi:NADPH:quinone reductase-like Zn-dependent oxidoreductase
MPGLNSHLTAMDMKRYICKFNSIANVSSCFQNIMSSDSKVALITGSTSGIGLACAHILAKRGVNLIITGSRDSSLVGDILEELKRLFTSD